MNGESQQQLETTTCTSESTWRSRIQTLFYAMIAEIDLVAKNLINIFFISRFLGAEASAAYELVMPCIMLVTAFVALGYNGVQAVCAKDYGAGDLRKFERHRNAGYTWILIMMILLTLLLSALKAPVLDMLGANDGSSALAELAGACYSTLLFCFIPQGIFSIAVCLLYLEERRTLLNINIILYSCILAGNIIVTVIQPSMTGYMAVNVIGAAAADLYLIAICFAARRKSSLAAFTGLTIRPADIREVFFTGLPSFMEYVFAGAIYLIENLYLLSRFSESLVAGVSVFEAIDNVPEIICVGFSFLVTASLGTKAGHLIAASSEEESKKAEKELDKTAQHLTRGAAAGSLILTAVMILLARPAAGLFLTGDDPEALNSAVLLTVSCALGFIFYMLNSELVCYFEIVEAYKFAHILLFSETFLLPLIFKLSLGELFGMNGFCMARFAAELLTFIMILCLIWKSSGHFPLHVTDCRMDKYMQRLILNRRNNSEGNNTEEIV